MMLFFLRLCAILLLLRHVRLATNVRRHLGVNAGIFPKFARAYNNPYHPEDDLIIENISDDDGDNLRFGEIYPVGQLTDSEKANVVMTKLKINGRYYELAKNVSEYNYDD